MNDAKPKCSAKIFGDRVQMWSCRNRAVVERNGKPYCKIHDPEYKQAKRAAQDAISSAFQRRQDDIAATATAIATKLGYGCAHWQNSLRGKSGYTQDILLSFDEARKLIERLKAEGR